MKNNWLNFFKTKLLMGSSLNAILVTLGILLFAAAVYRAWDHPTFRAFFINQIEAFRQTTAGKNNASFKRISLQVSGMSCGGCETKVKTAIAKLQGVKKVEVSYQQGLVNITVDSQEINAQTLIEVLIKAGYFATPKGL